MSLGGTAEVLRPVKSASESCPAQNYSGFPNPQS